MNASKQQFELLKEVESPPIIELARKAKAVSRQLPRLSHEKRIAALLSMADHIEEASKKILNANNEDLAAIEREEQTPDVEVLKKRLALSDSKLADITLSIRQVAKMDDPIGQTLMSRELDKDLILNKVACPIGLVAIIFESRPDALPQIVSLCLKSGNAAVLKGGKEAEQTNKVIFSCIQAALKENGIDPGAFALTHSRGDVEILLGARGIVDLIIPRGSNALVSYIMSNTQIPVLGHAAGICHIYVDKAADLEKANRICFDAKTTYPAACNAVETILIHKDVAAEFVPGLLQQFESAGVESRCDKESRELVKGMNLTGLKEAHDDDYGKEFSNLTAAVKVVTSLEAAIDHINMFSSNHTDAIVTEDEAAAERFFEEVDSAGVYQNASTRFADGFRYGFGAEVGISNGKMHPRGPVGLDGLTTYKYKLRGKGHVSADYSGENARPFLHRDLEPKKGKI